jgi:hypothetical protein
MSQCMHYSLYGYRDWKYFRYNGQLERENFLNFLNKIINPYIDLKSEKEIDLFMNASLEYPEKTDFFKNGFEGLPYNTLFSQHRRYRVLITLEDRTVVPSIMRRVIDAG